MIEYQVYDLEENKISTFESAATIHVGEEIIICTKTKNLNVRVNKVKHQLRDNDFISYLICEEILVNSWAKVLIFHACWDVEPGSGNIYLLGNSYDNLEGMTGTVNFMSSYGVRSEFDCTWRRSEMGYIYPTGVLIPDLTGEEGRLTFTVDNKGE